MVASARTPTGRKGRLRILAWITLILALMLACDVHAGVFKKKQEEKLIYLQLEQ